MSFPMDSYDWVMIQNVYSMGAGSKLNMTKPYITTGNYILKMSNYRADKKWMGVWEALYYCFLEDNIDKLMAFPRVGGIMRKNLERKTAEKMEEYRKLANWLAEDTIMTLVSSIYIIKILYFAKI
jgi:deoxyribodipyrimidine photolyase-related protein